jgi:hypothetical protein
LSYCDEDPSEPTSQQASQQSAQWVVSVDYDPGLNIIKRLFRKPDAQPFTRLRDSIAQSLQANSAIKIVEHGA